MLPPVVARLIADTTAYTASLLEANAQMRGFAATAERAGVAADASMARASEGVAASSGAWYTAAAAAETSAGHYEKAGKKFAHFGGQVALAAAGIALEAIHMASSFDQQMELVHTQAGASVAEMESLKQSVLGLAGQVGQSPEQLAAALYHVESAGFRGSTALAMVKMAAEGASIGQANLEATTQAMIGTMVVGFKDVHGAADAMAYMNTIVGMGDMRMQQLSAAIATGALPSFKSAGLGMRDFGAALATLTDNVTPADEAATRLRMTVALMAAPSQKATKALASIGLSGRQLAEDMTKPDGLLVAIQDLRSHLEATFGKGHPLDTSQQRSELAQYKTSLDSTGLSADVVTSLVAEYAAELKTSGSAAVDANRVMEHAFGGGRTSGAVLTLLEESGRLTSKYDELGTSATRSGALTDAWTEQQKQFNQQVRDIVASIDTWMVLLGNRMIPIVRDVISWGEKHKQLVKELAWGIGTALVGATVAWTAALLANPVTAIAVGLGALAFAVKYAWDHFRTFREVVLEVSSAVAQAVKGMVDFVVGAFSGVLHVIAAVVDHIPGIPKAWKKGLDEATRTVDQFKKDTDKTLSDLASAAQRHADETAINLKTPLEKRFPEYVAIAQRYHVGLDQVLHEAGMSAADLSRAVGMEIPAETAAAIIEHMFLLRNAAQALAASVNGPLAQAANNAYGEGTRAGEQFAQAIGAQAAAAGANAYSVAAAVAAAWHQRSPAKTGPLSLDGGSYGWGLKAAKLFAEGMTAGTSTINAAAMRAMDITPLPGTYGPAGGGLGYGGGSPVRGQQFGNTYSTNVTLNGSGVDAYQLADLVARRMKGLTAGIATRA